MLRYTGRYFAVFESCLLFCSGFLVDDILTDCRRYSELTFHQKVRFFFANCTILTETWGGTNGQKQDW